MNNEKYLGGLDASKALEVHQRTLYNWDKKGLLTPGNKRLYNVKKFIENKKCKKQVCTNLDDLDKNKKLNLCYVRVSSNNQKDDLKRQKELMIQKYPNHLIIEEIGSGLNLNKKGIKKIIKLAIAGKINELVVAYRDRLTRFGFKLIEKLINDYSKKKIIVLNEKDKIEPEEELVNDIMSIMNVYVAKMNSLRKYRLKEEK